MLHSFVGQESAALQAQSADDGPRPQVDCCDEGSTQRNTHRAVGVARPRRSMCGNTSHPTLN